MSVRIDASDPAIQQAINDVKDLNGSTRWLRKGFHTQINARSEKDIKEQIILDKLTKATGAAYDAGARNQGSAKLVPSSVAQGREQASKSNAKVRTFEKTQGTDQSTENKPSASSITYESRALDQTTESRPAPSSIKYQQPKQDQSTESTPVSSTLPGTRNASATPAVKGSASSIKARFEQGAQSSTPSNPPPSRPVPGRLGAKVSVPPPQQSAPPPVAPKPVPPPVAAKPPPAPVPEPEPEPETYEPEPQEPVYEPEAAQETYEAEPVQENYEAEPFQDQQNYDQNYEQSYEPTPEEQPVENSYEPESVPQESEYFEGGTGGGSVSAKALYDYDAENADDLSFKEGDIITVLDQSDPSGWWEGEMNGVRGFFPSNFVELQQ